jgi:ABC-type transport system substrate-binding protein/D-alanyl-D-alanine dipeptidase
VHALHPCQVFAAALLLAAAAQAKPLVYCADASPEGFDPALWDSTSTSNVTTQIFQGLVAFARGSSELRPELATAWNVSPDAKTFTFTLRRGVSFHTTPYFTPTRDFNADDVLFTLQRLVDRRQPFNKAFPATFVYPQSLGLAEMIAGIDKLDAHTVRVRLHRANINFLSYFAGAYLAMHSAEYAAKLLAEGRASAINNQPIGTGPYRFKSYRKDDVLRLQPHPGYWRGAQQTTTLVYAISREPNVRVQKLARGECHLTAPIRDVDITALTGHPQISIQKIQALNISYLAFNLKKPPVDQREVREALDIAVDRNALFKVLFPRGDATQAVSAFPPAVPGFNKTLKNEFSPERAKQLLAAAGLANGFDIDLWALPVSRPTNPNGQLMAQMIQQDWARIGVRTRIVTYEWGEYLKRANSGEHFIYMSGWSSDVAAADEFLTPNLTCQASRGGIKFCGRRRARRGRREKAPGDDRTRASHLQTTAPVDHDGALVGLHPHAQRREGVCHVAQRQRRFRRGVQRMKTLQVEEIPGHAGFRSLKSLRGVAHDLRYAGDNNFAGRNWYGELDCAWLRDEAAAGLEAAAAWLAQKRPGWRLLVLDALRPQRVQEAVWRTVVGTPGEAYFANPERGSIHSWGMAVDATLLDAQGQELDMGTHFDAMTLLSHPERHAEHLALGLLAAEHINARGWLAAALRHGGFAGIRTEWWHFELGERAAVRRDLPRVL